MLRFASRTLVRAVPVARTAALCGVRSESADAFRKKERAAEDSFFNECTSVTGASSQRWRACIWAMRARCWALTSLFVPCWLRGQRTAPDGA